MFIIRHPTIYHINYYFFLMEKEMILIECRAVFQRRVNLVQGKTSTLQNAKHSHNFQWKNRENKLNEGGKFEMLRLFSIENILILQLPKWSINHGIQSFGKGKIIIHNTCEKSFRFHLLRSVRFMLILLKRSKSEWEMNKKRKKRRKKIKTKLMCWNVAIEKAQYIFFRFQKNAKQIERTKYKIHTVMKKSKRK